MTKPKEKTDDALTDEDAGQGYKSFEIIKGRFCFRLTAPYNEERRRAASEGARWSGIHKKVSKTKCD